MIGLILSITILFSSMNCGIDDFQEIISYNDYEKITNIDTKLNMIVLESIIDKTWVAGDKENNTLSFSFKKIEDNHIIGEIGICTLAVPSSHKIEDLEGDITSGFTVCNFNQKSSGDKGTLIINVISDKLIEAKVCFNSRSKYSKFINGVYKFRPYYLSDLDEYNVLSKHSVSLNTTKYGKVKFVPVMFPSKTHEPKIGLYLVNDNEEIVFRFFPDLPRGVNFDSVRLEDVNDDGLNDFIVLAVADDYKNELFYFVNIYVQTTDGRFVNDNNLDEVINTSITFNHIDQVIEYINKHH